MNLMENGIDKVRRAALWCASSDTFTPVDYWMKLPIYSLYKWTETIESFRGGVTR